MRPGAALPTSAQAHAALEFVNRTELGDEHDGDLKCEMAALRALLEQARTPHRAALQIGSAIRCPCARVGPVVLAADVSPCLCFDGFLLHLCTN